MEINEYIPKQNRLNNKISEYEASQVKAQHVKTSASDNKSVTFNKNERPIIKGGIPLSIGQASELVVSDEVDGQITLRYIDTANNTPMNDIIHKALYASGLILSERNLAIVEELLNYQMPVDKNTILQLIKLTATYSDANPATLVLMLKNNLPINPASISQFEAYQKGTHQILSQLRSIINNINTITFDNNIQVQNHDNPENVIRTDSASPYNPNSTTSTEDDLINSDISKTSMHLDSISDIIASSNIDLNSFFLNSVMDFHKELLPLLMGEKGRPEQILPGTIIGNILNANELTKLKEILLDRIDILSGYSGESVDSIRAQLSDSSMTLESLLSMVDYLYDDESSQLPTVKNILSPKLISSFISMSDLLPIADREKLVRLLESDAYKDIITETLHSRWTMKPNDLTKENKVKEFFRRLYKDMEHLDKLTDSLKISRPSDFRTSINKLQDNLQFMRALNELFLYLQLPIRLTGHDAHGDLYVFTRNKHKQNHSELINVLLHLDMVNLGSIDIHISMKDSQINAIFYVEKDSELIISQNLHELVDSLRDKGYQLHAKTKVSESKPDFIADILQHNTSASNTHRYSFDIRA